MERNYLRTHVAQLLDIFCDEQHALIFLVRYVYGDTKHCTSCNSIMNLYRPRKGHWYYHCTNSSCGKEHSILSGTIFQNSRTPMHRLLRMILFIWLRFPQKFISLMTGIERHSIKYYQSAARVISNRKITSAPILLGGPGRVVEIDEALIRKRKYNRGKGKQQIWIFGGVERTLPLFSRAFITIVPDRSAATLLPIILEYVLPGTHIMSDQWRSYACLKELGYIHTTVNHKLHFRDPETGTSTNIVESMWAHLRRFFPRSGVREDELDDYIADFLYEHRKKVPFVEFLKEMSSFKTEHQTKKEKPAEIRIDPFFLELTLMNIPSDPAEKPNESAASVSDADPGNGTSSSSSSSSSAAELSIEDELFDVPTMHILANIPNSPESDSTDDSFGAGSGESASEWCED